MEGKPFALIGVNTNGYDPEKMKAVMQKENLVWRSFADQDRRIFSDWRVQGTPTLYLIDHKGTIRHRWIGSPGAQAIDSAIEALVKEAETS